MERTGIDPPRTVPAALAALPNLLTLTRLGVGLVFPVLPERWWLAAFLLAAGTEALDGQLARLLRATSITGQVLDPIADKVFILAVLARLVARGTLAPWQLVLVAARDICVLGGLPRLVLRRGTAALKHLPPTWIGKATTAAQFTFLLVVLATGAVPRALLALTAVLSLAAGLDYIRRFLR